MKIHFTKKEYKVLLDTVSICSWILHAHGQEHECDTKVFDDLEQKIFSYAKDFRLDSLISYDKGNNSYSATFEYEESEPVQEIIAVHEEEVFWNELVRRLAKRDLLKELGDEAVGEMDPMERFTKEDEIAARYDDEFVKNGIANLIIAGK